MNQFKQLLLLFVSISGLISCSPDNSDNSNTQQPMEENKLSSRAIEQILIKRSDGSFRILEKGLESIEVGSQIKLVYKKGVNPQGTLRTDVTCHTPQRQEALFKTTNYKMEDLSQNLSLLNLLPPKVLAPLPKEERINCDLKLEIIEENILTVSISFENISLENTNFFSNWDILPDASEEMRAADYLFRTSKFKEMPLSFQEGEMNTIHTICEDSQTEAFNVKRNPNLSEFFEESLFEDNPVSMCRLIAVNDKNQSLKVSQVLNVEGRWSMVRMLWDIRLSATNNPVSNLSEAMIIKIENNGTDTALINFKVPGNPNIKIRPHYGNPLPHGKIWLFPETTIDAQWVQVSTGEAFRGENIIEIPPHSFENFELRPRNNLKCPLGQKGFEKNPCAYNLYLGSTTKVSVPTISAETQINRTEREWLLLSKKLSQQSSNGQITQWLPTSTLNQSCSNFPTVLNTPANQGPFTYQAIDNCTVD